MAHGESPRHSRKRPTAASKRSSTESKSNTPRSAKGDPEADSSPAGTHPSGKIPVDGGGALGAMRLQKLLASAGFGSRRDVERFLTEKRVTVNGRVATLGDRADPTVDEIRFDGERLLKERPTYWIVNKPRGVVTTVRDNEGRRTVIDLMPSSVGRVFPVGRLDRETSGLLLMTNDGDLSHTLLHPSLGNEREYRVNVKGNVDARVVTRLQRGVNLEEGRMSPAQVDDVRYDSDSGTTSLSLTLIEGKKRQIRRSLLFLGHPVRRLARVRMGPLRLGRLKPGEARALRPEEKRALFEHVRRLRAGETPKPIKTTKTAKATSSRGEGASRGSASRNQPARPPRPKIVRRTRGGAAPAATRSGPKTGTKPGAKVGTRPSARPSTRPSARPSSARPGAKFSATSGPRTGSRFESTTTTRKAGSGGRPNARKPSTTRPSGSRPGRPATSGPTGPAAMRGGPKTRSGPSGPPSPSRRAPSKPARGKTASRGAKPADRKTASRKPTKPGAQRTARSKKGTKK